MLDEKFTLCFHNHTQVGTSPSRIHIDSILGFLASVLGHLSGYDDHSVFQLYCYTRLGLWMSNHMDIHDVVLNVSSDI